MRLLQAFFDAKVPQLLFDGLLFALVLPMSIQLGRRYGPWIALGRERRAIAPILLIPALCAAFNTFFDLLEALNGPPIPTTPLWSTLVLGLLLLTLLWWGPTYRYLMFFVATLLTVGIAVFTWLTVMIVRSLVETFPFFLRYRDVESVVSLVFLALLCAGGTLFLLYLDIRFVRFLLASKNEGATPPAASSAQEAER